MLVSEGPIIVQEKFDSSPEIIWKAITEIDQMKIWYFDEIKAFKPVVGFETQFTIEHNGRTYPHTWKILEVIPHEKIVYNWHYPNYPGNSFVTFELFPQNTQTTLKLTATVTEDFPQNIPEFKRESCVGGWTYFIKESLKKYLEGST